MRWHASRDAPRHRFVPLRTCKPGRGASRTTLPRRAWER
ncbi:DUF1534 domain-containing protein [Pseudomonas congelans]|nr:DUF1534 domain-containing protein [Pseudomonas congelans]